MSVIVEWVGLARFRLSLVGGNVIVPDPDDAYLNCLQAQILPVLQRPLEIIYDHQG